jgi:hypothetical protein
MHVSNKEIFKKIPINRYTKKLIPLQILQLVSVIWKYLRNFEGFDPKGFKFTMLVLVLFGCIPFEYLISQLEILFIVLPVRGMLDPLLMFMCFVQHLLSSLFHFYQLLYSSDHIIRLPLVVLE